jgi:hypothetical protein
MLSFPISLERLVNIGFHTAVAVSSQGFLPRCLHGAYMVPIWKQVVAQMAVAKLTKSYVAALNSRAKTYIDWDRDLAGFGNPRDAERYQIMGR